MALLVTINHLAGVLQPLPGNLYHAVDVFFVLSGFVLCHVYDRAIPFRGGGFARFLRNRFARIVPVAWLGVAVFWAVPAWAQLRGIATRNPVDVSWGNLLANLAFLDSNIPGFESYGTKWSLSNEMAVYLLIFPFAWLLRDRRVAAVALGTICLGQIVLVPHFDVSTSLLARCVPCFLVGCCLFHLGLRQLPTAFVIALGGIGCGGFLLLDTACAAWSSTLVVLAALMARGLIGKILGSRAFQWLGNISFSLYTFHSLGLYAVGLALKQGGALATWYPLWSVIPITCSLVGSHIVWRWFERPLHAALRS